jgi:hypothetical protein
VVPNATGTGTQNKLAKWTDGAGTLGDSVVTEASGNIGIGTSSPQAALHVIGNQFVNPVGATPTYKVLAGSDPTSTVMLTTDSSAFGWQIAPTTAPSDTIVQVLGKNFANPPNRGEFGIYLGADSNSAFKVIQRGGPELMRVNRTGNVGIGTSVPATRLHVLKSGDYQLRLENQATGGGFWNIGQTDNSFNIGGGKLAFVPNTTVSNSAAVVITNTGDVGIGATSPQAKLDVRGDVKLGSSGQLFAPGGQENLRIIRGIVDKDGNILQGSGFTAQRESIGLYTITFNTPFSASPVVTTQLDDVGFTTVSPKPSFVVVVTFDASPDPTSIGFSFIAVGLR